jgi:hypothetical protein
VLASNSTIRDVRTDLAQPERYVRLVLANIMASEREHGPVVVRIGITGTGQFPHYRIDRREMREAIDLSIESSRREEVHYEPIQAFNGRNHKPLANVPDGEEVDVLREEHWSEAAMSREDVMNLLGAIRQKGSSRTP